MEQHLSLSQLCIITGNPNRIYNILLVHVIVYIVLIL